MNNIELIDKYFNNSLSPKEQLKFNELLQNDDKFKKEFVFQKDLKKVISKHQQNDLKKVIEDFEKENSNMKFINIPKKWLVAASIVFLIGVGFVFVKSNFYPSSEQLYVENFEPYRNIVFPVERSIPSNSIEQSAFVAYENNNYHKAINLFNSIPNNNDNYVIFYKAMCYMSLDKTEEAVNLLLSISDNNSGKNGTNFEEISTWYLGLAYLKLEQNNDAMEQFKNVTNGGEAVFKYEEAENLLKYLE